MVTEFGIELRKAVKNEPNDWIKSYLQRYTPHEVYSVITQSRNLKVKELSAPLSEEFTLEDTVERYEEQTGTQDTQTELNEIIALSNISEGELAVINARYIEGRTLEEIGKDEEFIQKHNLSETGKKRLTREMIRVIEARALKKLKRAARRTESKVNKVLPQ